MEKIAQKRKGNIKKFLTTNWGDYLGGLATEKLSGDFAEIVERMNKADDDARAIALGEKHGKADAPEDPISLEEVLKNAKSNVASREYIKAVADLGRFHKKVFDLTRVLLIFKINFDNVHREILFKDLDDNTKEHLKSLKSRWTKKTALNNYSYFVKEAGIMDFFSNLMNKAMRGSALAAWEKRYPAKVKQLKNDTISLLNSSYKLLNIIKQSLSVMDDARTVRRPDLFVDASEKIIREFTIYDAGEKGFKNYYDKNVKQFLESQDFVKEVETSPNLSSSPASALPIQPVVNPQTSFKPEITQQYPARSVIPTMPPVPKLKLPEEIIENEDPNSGEKFYINKATKERIPNNKINELITPNFDPKYNPKTRQKIELPFDLKKTDKEDTDPKNKKSHFSFYESLRSMSEESPRVLSAYISKYAKSIKYNDPETAVKLFNLASSIEK